MAVAASLPEQIIMALSADSRFMESPAWSIAEDSPMEAAFLLTVMVVFCRSPYSSATTAVMVLVTEAI